MRDYGKGCPVADAQSPVSFEVIGAVVGLD